MSLRRLSAGTPSFLFILLATCLLAGPVRADWPADGLVVSPHGAVESLVPDGSGGVDAVIGYSPFLIVQHVTANGDRPLGATGFVTPGAYSIGKAVSNGAGGVFVPIILGSSVSVANIAVEPVGSIVWQTDAATDVPTPSRVHCGDDGAGGVIVVWSDERLVGDNPANKVFTQRMDGAGNALWQTNGLLVAQRIDVDPRGGPLYRQVYAVGVAHRGPGESTIFVSYENEASYNMGWVSLDATGGFGGSNGSDLFWVSRGGDVIPDGAGGAYVPQGPELDHFSSSAVREWTKTHPGDGYGRAVLDGTGGVLFAWSSWINGGYSLYCQRYSARGGVFWGGGPFATGSATRFDFAVAPDYSGGALVAWTDSVSGNQDIYYQHLDRTGHPLLDPNGVLVSAQPEDETGPELVSYPDGYAIVSWTGGMVRAQRIDFPLAISAFTAQVGADGVQLAATFRPDPGIEQQVHVYRGEADSAMTLLDTVAPSQPGSFQYVDAGVEIGRSYRYQIGVFNAYGEFFSPVDTVSVPRPQAALEQNRPNPFNPATVIGVTLPSRVHATLKIYDVTGRPVRVLADAVLGPGREEFTWDGRDDRGTPVASGVYFYRVRAGSFTATRRMVLLK